MTTLHNAFIVVDTYHICQVVYPGLRIVCGDDVSPRHAVSFTNVGIWQATFLLTDKVPNGKLQFHKRSDCFSHHGHRE